MTRDEGPGVGVIIFHISQEKNEKVEQAEFKAIYHCENISCFVLVAKAGVACVLANTWKISFQT